MGVRLAAFLAMDKQSSSERTEMLEIERRNGRNGQ